MIWSVFSRSHANLIIACFQLFVHIRVDFFPSHVSERVWMSANPPDDLIQSRIFSICMLIRPSVYLYAYVRMSTSACSLNRWLTRMCTSACVCLHAHQMLHSPHLTSSWDIKTAHKRLGALCFTSQRPGLSAWGVQCLTPDILVGHRDSAQKTGCTTDLSAWGVAYLTPYVITGHYDSTQRTRCASDSVHEALVPQLRTWPVRLAQVSLLLPRLIVPGLTEYLAMSSESGNNPLYRLVSVCFVSNECFAFKSSKVCLSQAIFMYSCLFSKLLDRLFALKEWRACLIQASLFRRFISVRIFDPFGYVMWADKDSVWTGVRLSQSLKIIPSRCRRARRTIS